MEKLKMTRGYTRPFSPQGNASIIEPLPWRFAGDLHVVHFRADPNALNALLPPPLAPPEHPGDAFLWSVRFMTSPDEDGVERDRHPARSNYTVAVIGVPCLHNGNKTMISAFQWCDRDWLVVMSWFLGACSKQAEIEESGTHPLAHVSGSPQTGGMGTTFNRSVSRNGQEVLRYSVTPSTPVSLDDLAFYTDNLPLTCERHFPDVHYPPRGKPDVHDLCQMLMSDTQFGEIRKGTATLSFGSADNEDLLPIQPSEVLGGYILPMGFKLRGIRVTHDYLAPD
jgi:hypothetical protein